MDCKLLRTARYYNPLGVREHWENTLGLIVLFQTVNTLLSASPTGAPKFVYISSSTGSIRRYMNMNSSPSGSSKTAANFLIKAPDVENPSLAISPGGLPLTWVTR
ncbi:hypothetical protein B0H14DRAFT_2659070, partial [Mycena olivaceomarginata]